MVIPIRLPAAPYGSPGQDWHRTSTTLLPMAQLQQRAGKAGQAQWSLGSLYLGTSQSKRAFHPKAHYATARCAHHTRTIAGNLCCNPQLKRCVTSLYQEPCLNPCAPSKQSFVRQAPTQSVLDRKGWNLDRKIRGY